MASLERLLIEAGLGNKQTTEPTPEHAQEHAEEPIANPTTEHVEEHAPKQTRQEIVHQALLNLCVAIRVHANTTNAETAYILAKRRWFVDSPITEKDRKEARQDAAKFDTFRDKEVAHEDLEILVSKEVKQIYKDYTNNSPSLERKLAAFIVCSKMVRHKLGLDPTNHIFESEIVSAYCEVNELTCNCPIPIVNHRQSCHKHPEQQNKIEAIAASIHRQVDRELTLFVISRKRCSYP